MRKVELVDKDSDFLQHVPVELGTHCISNVLSIGSIIGRGASNCRDSQQVDGELRKWDFKQVRGDFQKVVIHNLSTKLEEIEKNSR